MRPDAPLPPVTAVALDGHAGRRAWTGDEIAIDFPSLPPLVARMRESFFGPGGDPGDALVGDVALSERQARRGGTVLVEVPVWRVCSRCAGRGEIWDETCGQCLGNGHGVTRRHVEVVVPAGVRTGMWMAFDVTVAQAPATQVHLKVTVR